MQVRALQRDTVVPVNLGFQDLYRMVCEIRQDQFKVRQDQCELWNEINKIKSWRKSANERFARFWGRTKRYITERFNGVKEKAAQGRRRSRTNQMLLERTVLYQLSHPGCSLHNACHRAFVRLTDGYKNERCLYDYAKHHQPEVEQIAAKFLRECATANVPAKKLLDAFDAKHASLLQGIT